MSIYDSSDFFAAHAQMGRSPAIQPDEPAMFSIDKDRFVPILH